jgi:hypothetical protein
MTASNIEQFDVITGRVLSALYENFPVPRYLLVQEFVGEVFEFDDLLGVELINDEGAFFLASVKWLANAGYMEFSEEIHLNGFADVVLTAKGLETLKAVPASLQTGPSLGEKLVDATKGGAKEVVRGLVGEVLSLGSRIASTHLGLPG